MSDNRRLDNRDSTLHFFFYIVTGEGRDRNAQKFTLDLDGLKSSTYIEGQPLTPKLTDS
jgi:hypothetical protein